MMGESNDGENLAENKSENEDEDNENENVVNAKGIKIKLLHQFTHLKEKISAYHLIMWTLGHHYHILKCFGNMI